MNYDWKSKTKVQADSKLNINTFDIFEFDFIFYNTVSLFSCYYFLPVQLFLFKRIIWTLSSRQSMVRKLNWIFFSRRRRTRQWKHVWQFCSLEWAKSRSFWRRIEQKSRLQPSCQPTAEQYRRRYIFFVFFVLPTKYNDADVPWWIQQWKASYTGTYYSWGKPLTFCLFFIYWVDHTRRQFYLKREILLYSFGGFSFNQIRQ